MRFDILTLFPELFTPFLTTGMVGRAIRDGALDAQCWNFRECGLGKHRSVDDTPYGGGSGMVIRVDVIVAAMEMVAAQRMAQDPNAVQGQTLPHRVLLSPTGDVLNQRRVEALMEKPWVMLVCGRYEGFDARVHTFIDEEISLGDFVLAGGEVAAMAIVDACSRLLPGVLGSADSAMHESHSNALDGLLEQLRPCLATGVLIFLDEFVLQFQRLLKPALVAIDLSIAQTGFHAFQISLHFCHTRIPCKRGFKRCQRKIKFGMLRQVSRCNEAGAGDRSAQFGGMFPFDKFEERRLPRAIRTDETDLLAVLDLPIEIFKDALCAKDKCNV